MADERKHWYAEYRNGVWDIILDGQKRLFFQPDVDATKAAESLIAFVDGIGMHETLEPRRFSPKCQIELLEQHLSTLLQQ